MMVMMMMMLMMMMAAGANHGGNPRANHLAQGPPLLLLLSQFAPPWSLIVNMAMMMNLQENETKIRQYHHPPFPPPPFHHHYHQMFCYASRRQRWLCGTSLAWGEQALVGDGETRDSWNYFRNIRLQWRLSFHPYQVHADHVVLDTPCVLDNQNILCMLLCSEFCSLTRSFELCPEMFCIVSSHSCHCGDTGGNKMWSLRAK